MQKLKSFLIIIICSHLFMSCSYFKKEKEDVTKDKNEKEIERFEPNIAKKAEKFRDSGGSLQDLITKKDTSTTTYNFASNPMWRASLSVLKDIPLANVDFAGGVIITDWYSKGGAESIKISINFLSNEVSATSFEVNSFKKTCNASNECTVEKGSQIFSDKIKDKIIEKIRQIKIQEEKSKKKS